MISVKKLLGDAGLVLAIRVSGALAQFAFQIVVARQYGVESFGVFSIALTLTIVSSMVARWGADQWVLRELPASLLQPEQRNFTSVLGSGLAFVLAASALASFCLLLFADEVASFFVEGTTPEAKELVGIMILSVAPFAIVNFFAEVLRAIHHHASASILQTLMIPVMSVLLLLALLQLGLESESWIAVAYLCATLISSLLGGWLVWKVFRRNRGGHDFVWLGRGMMGESHSVAMVVLLSAWLAYADVLFLGWFQSVSEVGLYAAAQRIVLMLSFVLLSFNSLLGPRFAGLNQAGAFDELIGLYRKSTGLMVLLGMPIVLVLGLFSDWFLGWFGADFINANGVLWVLLIGQAFNVLTGPVGVLMMMMRHTNKLRQFTFITVILHLVLMIILVPVYGAMGAAIATCAGMLSLNTMCWRFVVSIRKQHALQTVTKDITPSHV